MRIPLTGGAYEARSIIADAQRCVNLYAEQNPEDSPFPFTYYPRPGQVLLCTLTDQQTVRCLYRASNGQLYAVCGPSVYSVSANWSFRKIGTIGQASTPVYMSDNGLAVFIVDGSANGYTINMSSGSFSQVTDANFYGSNRIDFLDTFFLFDKPNTPQWYISLSNSESFDPLDFADKTGFSDDIVGVVAVHREVWLIGELTTEIWYDAGAPDFAFQAMPGAYIEHGCAAKYSIAKFDLSVFWLSQDLGGHGIVLMGTGYAATRISTHAIENEISNYVTISDAIGFTYQQEGHAFYVLTFPSADKTWVYDVTSKQWHERSWIDGNGVAHRDRANCAAFAYDTNIVGDRANGNIYALDLNSYDDNGAPIQFLRSFMHLVKDGKRISYSSFIAEMQVGTDDGSDGTTEANPPKISLRWSDTRGASWGNPVMQSLGAAGQYFTSVLFRRLGIARDRVFEISWSVPTKTALNGAYIEVEPAET